jgi:hypothetical protein
MSGWERGGSSDATVPREKGGKEVLRAPLTVEGFATAEVAEQRLWHAGQRHGARTVMWSASDMRDGTVGLSVHEARRGRRRQRGGVFRFWPVGMVFNLCVHVRTVPPMEANQDAAWGDTATDRWTPHVSVFLN